MPGAIWVQFCERVIFNLHWIIRDSKVNSPEGLFSVNESCHAAWRMQSWRGLMMEKGLGAGEELKMNLLQGHSHQIWLNATLRVRWSSMLDYQVIPTSLKAIYISVESTWPSLCVCVCTRLCMVLSVHHPTLCNRKKITNIFFFLFTRILLREK